MSSIPASLKILSISLLLFLVIDFGTIYVAKMKLQAVNWNQRYGKYTHWAEKLLEDDSEGLEKL